MVVVGAGGGNGCGGSGSGGGGGAPYRRACEAAPAATARDDMVLVDRLKSSTMGGGGGGSGCDYEGVKVK